MRTHVEAQRTRSIEIDGGRGRQAALVELDTRRERRGHGVAIADKATRGAVVHAVTELFRDAIAEDPETEVKRKAVFALSQLPKDEGIPQLIQVARTNRNPEVRKQAIFWLGQSNDPRALSFIEEIVLK